MTREMKQKFTHGILLATGVAVLAWSAVSPHHWPTWVAEVAPAIIGWAIMIAVYRRFRFTTLAYAAAWFFGVILIVGGHYTYQRVPPGLWARDALGLARNHYDRFGHFSQGFTPAILAREVLLRTSPLRAGKWLFFVVICIAVAISAGYELFEWGSATVVGESGADEFIAAQGDKWDAQKDMFMALLGALAAQLFLARYHDRAIARIVGETQC